MAFPLLAAGAALGGLGSLIGGISAGKAQKRASGAQADIAKNQQALFQQAGPEYQNLLRLLSNYAQTGAMPYSYTVDAMNRTRLLDANRNITQNLNRAQDQLSFGLGRRGLAGSNLDVAGRAALLANADNQRSAFERDLAVNQLPRQFEHRLGLLGNALNPGLGAGQLAGSTFGQQAGMYGQQAGQAGANIGAAIQNFMLYDALRRAQQGQAGGGFTPPFVGGFGATPGGINANDFMV